MTYRVFAGALAAAALLAGASSAAEAAARGAAVSAPRVVIHRAPAAFMHRAPRHVHAPLRAAALGSGATIRIHHPDGHPHRHHRHFFGLGLPVTWSGSTLFYGNYYDPSDVVGALPVPPDADPPSTLAPAPMPGFVTNDRGGCRSEDVTVAAASGGERTITVTRC